MVDSTGPWRDAGARPLAGTVAPEALQAVFADPATAPPLTAAGPSRPHAGPYPLFLSVSDLR